jgi:hypothetical protein
MAIQRLSFWYGAVSDFDLEGRKEGGFLYVYENGSPWLLAVKEGNDANYTLF